MAIDNRDKRASALLISCPWRAIQPSTNNNLNAQDRAIVVYLYSGVIGASQPDPSRFYVISIESRTITLEADTRTYAIAMDMRTVNVPLPKDN